MTTLEPPSRRRHVICFVVVALLVALDLWSKAAVFAWFEDPASFGDFDRSHNGAPRYTLVGNWLAFMQNLNYGAAFGKGDEWPWVLVIGRGVAALLLIWLVTRVPRGQGVYLASLVLILSGALGNLYDNLFYEPKVVIEGKPFGPVRDFIDVYFGIWDWHFPTFNVADSCITVGAILLLASGFFGSSDGGEKDGEGEAQGSATP